MLHIHIVQCYHFVLAQLEAYCHLPAHVPDVLQDFRFQLGSDTIVGMEMQFIIWSIGEGRLEAGIGSEVRSVV